VLGLGCAYVHQMPPWGLVADAKQLSFIGISRQKLQREPDGFGAAIRHPDLRKSQC
jgi:hypothetical protein